MRYNYTVAKDRMREAIVNFPKQFKYEPKVENAVGHLVKFERFALMGMGGSALIGDLIKKLDPDLDIVVHKGYGLPRGVDLNGRLLIFVSYSGNTEETLDAFDYALKAGHHLAVVGTGGKLLDKAKKIGILYVELPNTDVQPRVSLGFQIRAVLTLMQQSGLYKEVGKLATVNFKGLEKEGEKLAKGIAGKIPLIYASGDNGTIAYNWKIKFNETGKIPAFWSVLPEANHNEINGFGGTEKKLSNFVCLFIKDDRDHSRVKKRMTVLGAVYKELGLSVKTIPLKGKSEAQKLFGSLILGDWTAYYTAKVYGNEANEVPLVKKFKKLIG
ncbi:MAG: N(2),N(2)-dimethylguanosine tRNA methyltransferase [Parcubacteria group bacterium GW2011_GWA1_47_11]|nr:MAG: N(2),N(2)-dimethylguanosine tRNA methyltransferase [Parcubacteria group bacterium GW2011_GWA2_46_10]KKU56153.1 MAG: N(2),N(2)-dimethylguanosine tRNA methyltransferase [Parcubacteria group bacterium GW2011_GWA1_47_11]